MNTMNDMQVAMVLENPDNAPDFPCPEGYSLRLYRHGYRAHWLRIHELADTYNSGFEKIYDQTFGGDEAMLSERQFFLCHGDEAVGTATAWGGSENYMGWGRIHWVAIDPAYQGKGLARLLVSAVLDRLRELGYGKVYLTTRLFRVAAIKTYLKFGFVPLYRNGAERVAWEGADGDFGSLPAGITI